MIADHQIDKMSCILSLVKGEVLYGDSRGVHIKQGESHETSLMWNITLAVENDDTFGIRIQCVSTNEYISLCFETNPPRVVLTPTLNENACWHPMPSGHIIHKSSFGPLALDIDEANNERDFACLIGSSIREENANQKWKILRPHPAALFLFTQPVGVLDGDRDAGAGIGALGVGVEQPVVATARTYGGGGGDGGSSSSYAATPAAINPRLRAFLLSMGRSQLRGSFFKRFRKEIWTLVCEDWWNMNIERFHPAVTIRTSDGNEQAPPKFASGIPELLVPWEAELHSGSSFEYPLGRLAAAGCPAALIARGMEFPPSSGINVNMMPFNISEITSLPESLRCYWPLIVRCTLFLRELKTANHICYLTIDEKSIVEGTTHRRNGLHVESPGALLPPGDTGFVPGEIKSFLFFKIVIALRFELWRRCGALLGARHANAR